MNNIIRFWAHRSRFIQILTVIILVAAVPVFSQTDTGDEDDDFDLSVPGWAVKPALTFINNIDDVFYNWHLDNVDYSPSLQNTHGSIRTNFLFTFFPFTWANMNAKVQVVGDSSFYHWMPQVDLTGNYGRIVAFDVMPKFEGDTSTDTFKPFTMSEYSAGVTLTKALSMETRMFAGFHYSAVKMYFEFPDEGIEITEETSLSKINVNVNDYILVTGMTNVVNEKKRMVAYVGYGFNKRKLFSRFAWHYDHLEMGFNIYPEALLVIHPFLGWHWNF